MKLMNEAVQVLRPGTGEDEDFKELVSQATSFRKILSQVKPSPKNAQNGTTLNWQANAKALTVYKVRSVEEYMGGDARKPVFGVSDKVRFK